MRSLTAAAVASLALSGFGAHADPAADARHFIQSAYTSTDTAFRHRDAAGTAAFYTPDYVSIGRKGDHSSAKHEQQSAAGIIALATGPITAKTTIQTFSLSGPNAATVTVHQYMAATLVNPRTRRTVKSTFEVTTRDLWIKTVRGWRERQSNALSEVLTINGQIVTDHSDPAST